MQLLKCAGCAGVATGSILVYAYILMDCFKNQGFENDGFENQWFLKEGFEVEIFFSHRKNWIPDKDILGLGQAAEDPLRVKGTLKKGASRLKRNCFWSS